MEAKRFERLKAVLSKKPRDLDDKCDRFAECSPGEYMELAIHALTTLCVGNGDFSKCRTDSIGWSAHHITKAIFEEQDIFDPYADSEFIAKIEAVCPWYVLRYTKG